MNLTHVRIVTGDLERLTKFYQEVLQIEPLVFGDEQVKFPGRAGGAILSLCSLEGCERLAPGAMEAAQNRSVQLEFEVSDIDREYERLRHLVIFWLLPSAFFSEDRRSIYFWDPDGNCINFSSLLRK